MINLSVSETSRAAALDPSLAFSVIFEEHRSLVQQSISSGVQGLLASLDQFNTYKRAISALIDSLSQLGPAITAATKDPFATAAAGTPAAQAPVTALVSGLNTQTTSLVTTTNSAANTATTARNNAGTGTPERAAADDVLAAANLAKTAVTDLRGGAISQSSTEADKALADANAAKTKAQSALTDASTVKTAADKAVTDAQKALDDLKAKTNPAASADDIKKAEDALKAAQDAQTAAAERVTDATAVVNAATTVVNAAQAVVNFKSEPIFRAGLASPGTTQDLANGYKITTWGNTGLWTLTGADGKGIIVQPNGSVDPLSGAGNGWQFKTTSTFVLPDETKITVSPGSPMKITAIRGRHELVIGDLQSGKTPTVTLDDGGRRGDKATNDGYRIDMSGGATDAWRMTGNTLGDTASREVVASTAITNELKIDAADVPISQDLIKFLSDLGVPQANYDSDLDGRVNEEELIGIAITSIYVIIDLQASFENVLAGTAKANQALRDLNRLLDGIRKRGEGEVNNRAETTAADKDLLASIQRRLESALVELKGPEAGAAPPPANGPVDAGTLLSGLQAAVTDQPTAPTTPAAPAAAPAQPVLTGGNDPSGQALRRASRLLSGLASGPEIPPVPGEEAAAGSPAPDLSTQATAPAITGEAPAGAPNAEAPISPTDSATPAVPPDNVALAATPSATPAVPLDNAALAATPSETPAAPPDNATPAESAVPGGEIAPQATEAASPLPVGPADVALLTDLAKILPTLGSTEGSSAALISSVGDLVGSLQATLQGGAVATLAREALPVLEALLTALGGLLPPADEPLRTVPSARQAVAAPPTPEPAPRALSEEEFAALFNLLILTSARRESQKSDETEEAPTVGLAAAAPDAGTLQTALETLLTTLESDLATEPSEKGTTPASADALPTQPLLTRAETEQLDRLLTRLQEAVEPTIPLPFGQPSLNALRPLAPQDKRRLEDTIQRLQTALRRSVSTDAAGTAVNPQRPVSRRDVQQLEDLIARLRRGPAEQEDGSFRDVNPLRRLSRADLQREENIVSALQSRPLAGNEPVDPLAVRQTARERNLAGPDLFADAQQRMRQIIGNFQTDPQLLQRLRENLNKALTTHNEHVARARSVFEDSQETVQEFVAIVSEDNVLKDVVKDDRLSDEKQADFGNKMQDLRQQWGIEWGSDGDGAPKSTAEEGRMVTRMVQSGMMV